MHYADGVVDEMLPSPQAPRPSGVTGPAARPTGLRPPPSTASSCESHGDRDVLRHGLTLNQGEPVTPEPTVTGLPAPVSVTTPERAQPGITPIEGGFAIESGLLRMDLQTAGGIRLRGLQNRCTGDVPMQVQPGPLFEIGEGDTLLASEQATVGEPAVGAKGRSTTLRVPVDGRPGGVPVAGELFIEVGESDEILMDLRLTVTGEAPVTPVVNFPTIRGLQLGGVEDTWYLWGRKGGIVSQRPINQRQAYGGEYPIQVADVFSPKAPGGLALLTYDLRDIYRHGRSLRRDRRLLEDGLLALWAQPSADRDGAHRTAPLRDWREALSTEAGRTRGTSPRCRAMCPGRLLPTDVGLGRTAGRKDRQWRMAGL